MKAPAGAAAALIVVALGVGKGAVAGQAVAGGESLQPGQWEMTTRVESVEMPGAPPEVEAQSRAQNGRTDVSRTCITPAQAADPLQGLRRAATSMSGQTCEIPENVFAGGAIRLGMTCRASGAAPTSIRMSMTGRYTATSIEARVSVDSATQAATSSPGLTIRVATSLTGRRLGDCPPAPPAPAPAIPPAAPAPAPS